MTSTKKRRGRRGDDKARVDMTPMIDVTFLLLIFFLCLEFKSLESKLPSRLPKDVGPSASPVEPTETLALRIEVTSPGTRVADTRNPARYELEGHRCAYWVGRRRAPDLGALESALRRAVALRVPGPSGTLGPRPLVVESGPGCRYGDVTAALDIAQASGFSDVRFAPAPRRR